jgi:TolB-like protein
MKLLSELKRRNVFRMAVLYIVAAWLVMQVVGVLIDLGTLPPRFGPFVLPLLVVGFPIALALSWFYEITPEGIALDDDVERDESAARVHGRRADFIVIALLAAAVILFAYDKWWIGPPPEKSVAVLPFLNMSDDPDQGYFSDGISEELLNVLAKYPELKVAARQSSFVFKDKDLPIAEIGRQLNVAHVVEGSVRKSGNRLRITAQLINAEDGFNLWSDTFDRQLEDVFAIQDEIAREIGSALQIGCLRRVPRGPEPGPSTECGLAGTGDPAFRTRAAPGCALRAGACATRHRRHPRGSGGVPVGRGREAARRSAYRARARAGARACRSAWS